MTNLIPPRAKKKLVTEYWARAVSTWLLLWSIALLIGSSILLPAYVLIGSQVDVYEASAAEASEKVKNYSNTSHDLVRASQQAAFVTNEATKADLSEFIELFDTLQGNEVGLTAVRLSRGEEQHTVTLTGVADSRQALADFRDRLTAEEVVDSVDLPLSNLARDKDIPFDIAVTLHKADKV